MDRIQAFFDSFFSWLPNLIEDCWDGHCIA